MNTRAGNGESSLGEERFRLVVESSPAAMVIVGEDGRIVLVNRQAEVWFGYERSELVGRDVEALIPNRFHDQHRVDRDRFLAAPQARPMGTDHELFARRKDGSEIPVDVSLHPIATEEGNLVMAHIVDLSDRKRAEQELQRRNSVQRLALLGQLAGSVAHEIRNPLGVIRNAAYYLQMIQETLDEEARASITEIQQEVARANHIVSDLLDYAREPRQRTLTFDIVARIQELIDAQQPLLDASISLDTAQTSLMVSADPDQIDRILVNLLRNGVQASEHTAMISLSIDSDSDVVIIDVTDEGTGILEADRPRIFDPLFTTKAKGIGLGLAVSKRYAECNRGSLDLLDRGGPGSTFRLRLPRADVPSSDE